MLLIGPIRQTNMNDVFEPLSWGKMDKKPRYMGKNKEKFGIYTVFESDENLTTLSGKWAKKSCTFYNGWYYSAIAIDM